jgi:poly-gamma-glutamate capsule biosynthesis protein CapA/YwtB (metallophosphatase superfamily)
VIGEEEDYGGARIYYSLGNFIFDQYWDASVRCGLTVKATFTKTGTTTSASYLETRTYLNPGGATTVGCP